MYKINEKGKIMNKMIFGFLTLFALVAFSTNAMACDKGCKCTKCDVNKTVCDKNCDCTKCNGKKDIKCDSNCSGKMKAIKCDAGKCGSK